MALAMKPTGLRMEIIYFFQIPFPQRISLRTLLSA
jgi:hypothetical protein